MNAGGGGAGGLVGNEDLPMCTDVTFKSAACGVDCYAFKSNYDFCVTNGYVCCSPWCRRGGVNDESKPPPKPTIDGICDLPKNCAPNGEITPPLDFCPAQK
jgi:hypothetical protein